MRIVRTGEAALPKEANIRLKEIQQKKKYTDEEMSSYMNVSYAQYKKYRLGYVPLFRRSLKGLPDNEYEYVCYGVNLNSKWKDLSIEKKKKVNEYIEALLKEEE